MTILVNEINTKAPTERMDWFDEIGDCRVLEYAFVDDWCVHSLKSLNAFWFIFFDCVCVSLLLFVSFLFSHWWTQWCATSSKGIQFAVRPTHKSRKIENNNNNNNKSGKPNRGKQNSRSSIHRIGYHTELM